MSRHEVERIQDSVHGLMEFRGMETIAVEVLRTPEIQRLRRIRQLGAVHFVFPGAEHSRFSHSLGAAHLATRFGRQIQHEARRMFAPSLVPDEHVVADLAIAALCHDMGHGPLSHAWEREIVGEYFDRQLWGKALGLEPEAYTKATKWHEMVGRALLNWPDGQLHRLLELQEKGTAKRIGDLLSGRYYVPYVSRLLSSDVDVDRADFIMRDTHMSGVAYGRFDLNWLISTCTIGRNTDSGELVCGFQENKAVRVIEQFLIARRAMYDTVYQHKAVRCIEGMIAMLLRRLKDLVREGAPPSVEGVLEPIIRIITGEALGPEALLPLDDFMLFVLIDQVAQGKFQDDTARDLAKRLQTRELFKIVPASSERVAAFLASGASHERLCEVIKPHVPGLPEYYLTIDNVSFRMLSVERGEEAMLVRSDGSATKASEHNYLQSYRSAQADRVRIFTVASAVEAVRKLIGE